MDYPQKDSLPGPAFASPRPSTDVSVRPDRASTVTPIDRETPSRLAPVNDSVLEYFLSIITCPIRQEVTSSMVVFNNQCYDKTSFERYKAQEEAQNQRRLDSGYSNDHC